MMVVVMVVATVMVLMMIIALIALILVVIVVIISIKQHNQGHCHNHGRIVASIAIRLHSHEQQHQQDAAIMVVINHHFAPFQVSYLCGLPGHIPFIGHGVLGIRLVMVPTA